MNELIKNIKILKNAGFIVRHKGQGLIEVFTIHNQYTSIVESAELNNELVIRKLLINDSKLKDIKAKNELLESRIRSIVEPNTIATININVTSTENDKKTPAKLKYLLVIIPKSSRAECIANLQ